MYKFVYIVLLLLSFKIVEHAQNVSVCPLCIDCTLLAPACPSCASSSFSCYLYNDLRVKHRWTVESWACARLSCPVRLQQGWANWSCSYSLILYLNLWRFASMQSRFTIDWLHRKTEISMSNLLVGFGRLEKSCLVTFLPISRNFDRQS